MDCPTNKSAMAPSLAKRLHQALTAGKEEIKQLLNDPAREVIENILKNVSLDEEHLLALLKRRDLSEDFLKGIFRHRLAQESHNIKLLLVHNPNTPAPVVLTLLPQLYLFELVAVCYLPGVTPDQKMAAERAIIQRIPVTPLGNKITLAHRGTATVVAELLKDGTPHLVEACLASPRLKEAAVYQFLTGPKANAETISMVARHERWKTRPNLKFAILRNQKTPMIWFTLFLPNVSTGELKNLLQSHCLTTLQKKEVEEHLRHRGGQ